MMKLCVIALLACFACDALSNDGAEFLSTQQMSTEDAGKSWQTIRGNSLCAHLAHKYQLLHDPEAVKYARSAIAEAGMFWSEYGCQRSYGSIASYKTAFPAEEEDLFEEHIPEKAMASDYKPEEHDMMFLQVKQTVTTMKKKGATESDCKDLADRMCKQVEDELRVNQKVVNKLPSGKKCGKLGEKGIQKASRELNKRRAAHTRAQHAVKVAFNSKVHMGTYRFASLVRGKCSQFFRQSSYIKTNRLYRRAVAMTIVAKGKVIEAAKFMVEAAKASMKMVQSCVCGTKKKRDVTWKVVSKQSIRARQQKAYSKCKMMRCILDNTPLSSSKCRARLPPLMKKALFRGVESAKCSKRNNRDRLVIRKPRKLIKLRRI